MASSRPWYRRREIIVPVAVVAIAVLAGGVVFAIQWAQREPGEASVEERLAEFRGGGNDESGGEGTPDAGVYAYEGSGTERLSFFDTKQPQGPSLPATLTHDGDGCFTFRIDYNENHWQSWRYCWRDGVMYEDGGQTFQSFEFVITDAKSLNDVTCDPASRTVDLDVEPGDTWSGSCTEKSELDQTSVELLADYTFVGLEDLEIDGEKVPAYHVRQVSTLEGDRSGDITTDSWFDPDTGLPLRNERDITVKSPAPPPINSVTYTETGEWQVASLTPQT